VAVNKNPNYFSHIRLATLASASVALLAGAATPANALGLFGEYRTAAPPRVESMPQRAVRPATPAARAKATVVAKATSEPNELAAKAKGPLQILVSLDKQELTLLSGGEVIARSRVSTGQRGRSTPTGVFSIIQKDRWHRSNLYDDAPMWFMQRITWSGVALHQGIVPNYPASHGCIRLPEAFAKQMWTTTQMGARVIITHEQAMPVEIVHPALFVPRKEPAPAMAQAQALEAAKQAWTFAELASTKPIAGMTMTDLMPSLSTPDAAAPALDAVKPVTRQLKPGPLSVFISRKEGKLFVRKGFEPLFDVPVTIARPAEPLGTHVFTATALNADASLRWNVVTAEHSPTGTRPAAALDRITIPQEAIERISELVAPGSSLTISDHGLGGETGKGTDFIVLTK
jgi:lipoprotein-anchoring transpeptidase ErfK/SrfK